MNIFSFLKSTAGKVAMSATKALVISAAVGGITATTIHNMASHQVEQDMQMRGISSLSSGFNYDGMEYGKRGFTAINVRNAEEGYEQIANSEEKARIEGYEANNDFGLGRAERLQNNFSIGNASQMGESEGLGLGANEAIQSRAAYTPSGDSSSTNVGAGVTPTASSSSSSKESVSGASQLASASMARASGSSFSGSSAPIAKAPSANGAASHGNSANGSVAKGEGYKFSGAMPTGNDFASLRAGQSGASTGFNHGKDARVSRADRAAKEKAELKDISKRSIDAAQNSHRSANEGSRAFLANAQNSGGMVLENGVETQATGSADFEAPNEKSLKALGNWENNAKSEEEKRDEARKSLMNFLFATIGTTIACMFAASAVLKYVKLWWKWLIAGAILAIAATMAGILVGKAINFMKDFHASDFPSICFIASGAVAAGITYVLITQGKLWEHALKLVWGAVKTIAPGMAMTVVSSKMNSNK